MRTGNRCQFESGGTSRPHQLAERFGHCELVADATLKAISTLKVLAKDHSVSDQILEELKTE